MKREKIDSQGAIIPPPTSPQPPPAAPALPPAPSAAIQGHHTTPNCD